VDGVPAWKTGSVEHAKAAVAPGTAA